MESWTLREKRRAAGLTLAQVARAAGTSESNVSAYERDSKHPNAVTVDRLMSVIDAGGDSPVHRQRLQTVPATAAELRSGLRQGRSDAELLRVVRQMRTDSARLVTPADRAAFYARPSTTGDRRWDLVLAGVVEDLALRNAQVPPRWVDSGALRTFWFVTPSPLLDAYVFSRSPISLQVRGVMVDPADLVAV